MVQWKFYVIFFKLRDNPRLSLTELVATGPKWWKDYECEKQMAGNAWNPQKGRGIITDAKT